MVYDPFTTKQIPNHQEHVTSYWHSTADTLITSELTSDITADVLIIGSGYTGLSCANELVNGGISNVHVLEANSIGWGCSSRNAGFVLPGSGRLGYQQMVNRFGQQQATLLHEQYLEAIDLLKANVKDTNTDVDQTENGYLKLAHSPKWFEKLKLNAEYLKNNFDYDVEVIARQKFSDNFVDHQLAHGAIRYTNGFGINPLKLVNHYAKTCLAQGVTIHSNTPAHSIDKVNGQHVVRTPKGNITAQKVVIATNGYTPSGFKTPITGKTLPVLTSVIVTRPLTPTELATSGFKTHQVMMDTRELKYYYRLLPDNRILFGGRSAISGKASLNPKYQNRLLNELKMSFVGLEKVNIDYSWTGWIAVAYDQMPHIFNTDNVIYYATGYCGSGVSFSAWAGKLMADMILDKKVTSPLMTPLPNFPFSPFRRIGQGFFYQYGRLKDWLQ